MTREARERFFSRSRTKSHLELEPGRLLCKARAAQQAFIPTKGTAVDAADPDGAVSPYFMRCVLGGGMNEQFRKEHARTVREIAEKADPITKKRLLDLASRYDDPGTQWKAKPLADRREQA